MPASTLAIKPDAYSGRTLGKYELVCRFSTGGMSLIFLAFQKGLAGFRKLVVLKQILPDVRGHEDFIRLFLDEAKITAAFNHPNIAQVYDLDIADGELFLAMEFVQGATLIEVAKACGEARQPIPVGFTLATVRDTAHALHYAHTFTDPMGAPRPVIHRDVAEKNIMVTYEGRTKLLDFGIAKELGRAGRTAVGMIRGTSGYMSPEQILGEPLDGRSDVFSLGVVLHECLTGMRLFKGKSPREELIAPLQAPVVAPSERVPGLPRVLDAVVLKALQRDRAQRFQSALELAQALEQAAGSAMWKPEQSGALVQRFFAERRDQTRRLLSEAPTSEITSVSKLTARLRDSAAPRPPPQPSAGRPREEPRRKPPPAASPEEEATVGIGFALPDLSQPEPAAAAPVPLEAGELRTVLTNALSEIRPQVAARPAEPDTLPPGAIAMASPPPPDPGGREGGARASHKDERSTDPGNPVVASRAPVERAPPRQPLHLEPITVPNRPAVSRPPAEPELKTVVERRSAPILPSAEDETLRPQPRMTFVPEPVPLTDPDREVAPPPQRGSRRALVLVFVGAVLIFCAAAAAMYLR